MLLSGLPCSLLTLFGEGQLVLLPAPSSKGEGDGIDTRRLPETPVWDFTHSGSNRQGQLKILRLWRRDSRDRTARLVHGGLPARLFGRFDLLGDILSYLTSLRFCLFLGF